MKQFSKGCSWKPIYVAGASSYLFACAFLVALLWPTEAATHARTCGERQKILTRLAQTYGEEIRSKALTDGRWLFELFASEETGTWTTLITSPEGISCVTGTGTDWESINPPEGVRA